MTDDLRKLAEAATAGPWHVDHKSPGGGNVQSRTGPVADARWFGNTHNEVMADYANARFISAANPTAILALLDERDELDQAWLNAEGKIEEQEAELRRLHAKVERLEGAPQEIDEIADYNGEHWYRDITRAALMDNDVARVDCPNAGVYMSRGS